MNKRNLRRKGSISKGHKAGTTAETIDSMAEERMLPTAFLLVLRASHYNTEPPAPGAALPTVGEALPHPSLIQPHPLAYRLI